MNKVLILYQSASAACGIGTWVEGLSHSLEGYGWDVTVGLAWGNRFHDPANIEKFRPGLKFMRMDGRSGTVEGRIQAIERAVRKVRPDIIILTVLDAAFEAVRRLRIEGLEFRFIVVNHGNLPVQAAAILERMDIVDMAVCVSHLSFEAMQSTSCGFEIGRVKHIANAVKIPAGRRQKNLSKFRVGYAGRLDDDKRAEDLLPFFKHMHTLSSSIELWVAGKGKQAENIELLAAEYPDQVQFFGELNREGLENEFYPGINVLVHFSPSEAWGYSIAEALSHGAVTVSSEFCGIHADGLVIEEKNGLIFPVGNPHMAAEMVEELHKDPVRWQRMSYAAREQMIEKFSLETFAKRWGEALIECQKLDRLPMPEPSSTIKKQDKFGLPAAWWEFIRRLVAIRIEHASPGEEWPHYQCHVPELLHEMEARLHV